MPAIDKGVDKWRGAKAIYKQFYSRVSMRKSKAQTQQVAFGRYFIHSITINSRFKLSLCQYKCISHIFIASHFRSQIFKNNCFGFGFLQSMKKHEEIIDTLGQ